MDYKKYKEKKAAGRVVVVSAGDSFAIATQKFDPDTGADLPDEVIGVNMAEVLSHRQGLSDEIANIDFFIADCEALKKIK